MAGRGSTLALWTRRLTDGVVGACDRSDRCGSTACSSVTGQWRRSTKALAVALRIYISKDSIYRKMSPLFYVRAVRLKRGIRTERATNLEKYAENAES